LRTFDLNSLTLGYLTVGDDPFTVVDAAAAAGFSSVSLRISGRKIGDDFTPIVSNPRATAHLRQRIEDAGLRLSNVSSLYFFPSTTIDDLLPVIDTTAELGCDTIMLNAYIDDEGHLSDLFARYCEAAARHRIRVALEFMRFSCVKTLQGAIRIIERSGVANGGIVVDALHLERSGGTTADIAGLPPERIYLFQICDGPVKLGATDAELRQEAFGARLYPGAGSFPLRALLKVLPEDTELEIETPRPAEGRDARLTAIEARSAVVSFLSGA
jgi:sugar phosphate isomerase/epimerase